MSAEADPTSPIREATKIDPHRDRVPIGTQGSVIITVEGNGYTLGLHCTGAELGLVRLNYIFVLTNSSHFYPSIFAMFYAPVDRRFPFLWKSQPSIKGENFPVR